VEASEAPRLQVNNNASEIFSFIHNCPFLPPFSTFDRVLVLNFEK